MALIGWLLLNSQLVDNTTLPPGSHSQAGGPSAMPRRNIGLTANVCTPVGAIAQLHTGCLRPLRWTVPQACKPYPDSPGALRKNWLERASGRIEPLGHLAEVQMAQGDVFVVRTPGGGGCGGA
jgi:hypothetical protein